jgi:hypothetical protein
MRRSTVDLADRELRQRLLKFAESWIALNAALASYLLLATTRATKVRRKRAARRAA